MTSHNPAYPPGPKGAPLLGTLPQFRRDRLGFLMQVMHEYGELAHMRFGPRHVYLLNNPDDVRRVLVEEPDAVNKTPMFKRATRSILGEGLLTSEGDLHKRQRRLVQPAFHAARIARYGEVMVARTQRLLDGWQPEATFDVHQAMMRLTLDIVSETLFGADVSDHAEQIGRAIDEGLHFVVDRTARPFALPEWMPTPENLRARRRARLLDGVIMEIINRRRASGEDRGDLLSMLLLAVDEEGTGKMSNRQARDEAMTLFIAGHETTANALTWTFYLLAQHPAVENALRAELDDVLGGRLPTVDDLPRLTYTDMALRESMRLYPPAWVVPRYVVRELTLGGYSIAPQSILLSSPYTMHRNPRFFPNPERFLPERFAGNYEERLPRYAYYPFGGGPRVCIGNNFALMEAKLVLATIVPRWRLELAPGQTVTPEPLVTLRPRNGVLMTAHQTTPAPAAAEGAALM